MEKELPRLRGTSSLEKPKAGEPSPDGDVAMENIASLVRESAVEMVKSAIGAAKEGQLAHLKYLLELADIYPRNEESMAAAPEESLTFNLLTKLGLATEPANEKEKHDRKKESKPVAKSDGNCEIAPAFNGSPSLDRKNAIE
jgi:hypothetical protein